MKNKINIILSFVLLGILFSSCEDYLERTPEADVAEEDIFGTYLSFQGFMEPLYRLAIDYNTVAQSGSMNIGGDVITAQTWSPSGRAATGEYTGWVDFGQFASIWKNNNNGYEGNATKAPKGGIWPYSWEGIRKTNVALANLSYLESATDEERALIEGQAYFFRAYFHLELIKMWGGMPYIDQALSPNDDIKFPRLSFQECADKIAADFDKAAALLPVSWDDVLDKSKGTRTGHATKGAALAFKARALLYAGSPFFYGFYNNGDYNYNNEYMVRAAAAAWEVIKMANQGAYSLTPFENYQDMFARVDGTVSWTDETIYAQIPPWYGPGWMNGNAARIFVYPPSVFNGNAVCEAVTQNFVDRFEMADGTLYKPEYDTDGTKRWENRDPRFKKAIWVDGDNAGFTNKTIVKLFVPGPGQQSWKDANVLSPYLNHKFIPQGCNKIDKNWGGYSYTTPLMRLADVYLMYAEAVNEAYGPSGTVPGASLTALQAVNIVRARAGMPNVLPQFTGSKEGLRDRIWNERCVELCFESHYWIDTRRWHIAHTPEINVLYGLEFDKNYTYFNRNVITTRVFEEPKHYWLPLPKDQVFLYDGFYQNPGWN